MNKNTWICILSVDPLNMDTILFYNNIKQKYGYNIISVVDNNKYLNVKNDYIEQFTIENHIVEKEGYKGNVLWKLDRASARDKALYYFNRVLKQKIDYVWFIEEDVFVPCEHTIPKIDISYPMSDLLSKSYDIFESKKYDWHWNVFYKQVDMDPPYVSSMICAIRCSKRLLDIIDDYAVKNKTLFLDEVFFTTLTFRNGLIGIPIKELETIQYKHDWNLKDINVNMIYHPIKDIQKQNNFRKKICN